MKTIRRIIGCLLLLIAVIVAWNTISHRFWNGKEEDGTVRTLRILTYNTHRMGMYEKPRNNRVIRYLQESKADILCLQEVEVYKNPRFLTLPELRAALLKYPYTYYDFKVHNATRQFGNVVFSKYPLKNKHTIRYDSRANLSSCCDVLLGADTLRLIVNHLESNRFEQSDFAIPDSLTKQSVRSSAERINRKLETARKLRIKQAQEVKREIRQSPHPVIVTGDFNSTPLSYTYQKIKFGLRDCFLESSFGRLGHTFEKYHLGIRIDYILCSRRLKPIRCEVERVRFSDHYPVTATIAY